MIPRRRFFQRWFPTIGANSPCNSLHTVEVMQGILDRERMRCDRGNSSFALLALTFPKPWDPADLNELGQVFRDRIRTTDDAGILGPCRLGVVLPETQTEGAWTLAEDLCRLFPAGTPQPECEVYTYPTQPVDGEPLEVAHQDEPSQNGESSNGHLQPSLNGEAAPRRDERPMEVFFVRPLPGWKRAIDVLGAGTAVLLAAPLMLLVAVAIKLTSRGPVIFKQYRDTIGGRKFTVYKFRTMTVDAEERKAELLDLSEQDGPAFKIAKDPRVTPLGRFLRVTSIDELPQLFNVVLGDMTLVGPRALPSNESNNCESWQRRRLDVTAGITCIWQIRGRSSVSFAEWMRMDLSYIRSRSPVNDLKLIAQTVPAVLLRRGAC